MNIIKTIMADIEAVLKRIETEVAPHLNRGTALAGLDQAKAALAQHPDASASPSTIVSPGKEAPEAATDAPAATETPANGDPGVAGETAATPATPAA